MIAIQGVYDGKMVRPLEPVHAPANVRVLISFPDSEPNVTFKPTRLENVAGCLEWKGPPKTLADMEEAIARGAKERMG